MPTKPKPAKEKKPGKGEDVIVEPIPEVTPEPVPEPVPELPPPPDPFVTVQDAVECGHCASGVRRWLTRYGIDRKRFFRGEVKASELIATGDANGIQVANHAIKRASDG